MTSSIGRLDGLISLYLTSYNGGIPDEIGYLSNLTTLTLWYCQITKPVPSSIGKLSSLKTVWLALSSLTGEMPESFGDLINLESLTIDPYTRLGFTGAIPSSIGRMKSLKTL
ncbi:hypothetical protein HDU76_008354 [Blyttiomyces sp. JEL0837]|nr:hypothetical protein HDU76_008354 [Blyttiomyces sp. JEL0837]